MTKLAPKLPEGDSNGLNSLARRLIDEPNDIHVIDPKTGEIL